MKHTPDDEQGDSIPPASPEDLARVTADWAKSRAASKVCPVCRISATPRHLASGRSVIEIHHEAGCPIEVEYI